MYDYHMSMCVYMMIDTLKCRPILALHNGMSNVNNELLVVETFAVMYVFIMLAVLVMIFSLVCMRLER